MKNPCWFTVILLFIVSCSDSKSNLETVSNRHYSPKQVEIGEKLYQANCQSCHQEGGKGDENYHQMAQTGVFLNPPLNNDSMMWHRDYKVIQDQIAKGTMRFEGGKMPGFEHTLSEDEIQAIISYLMSLWSDETYQRWKNEVNQTKLSN